MPDEEKAFYPITAIRQIGIKRYINATDPSDIKTEKAFININPTGAKFKRDGALRTIKGLFTTGALELGLTDYGIRLTAYAEAGKTETTYEGVTSYAVNSGPNGRLTPVFRFGIIMGMGNTTFKWKPRIEPLYDPLTHLSEGTAFLEHWINPDITFKYWGTYAKTTPGGEGKITTSVLVNKLIFPLTIGVQTNDKLKSLAPYYWRRDTFVYSGYGDLPYLPSVFSPKQYVVASDTDASAGEVGYRYGMTRNDSDITKATACGGYGTFGAPQTNADRNNVFRKLLQITVDPSIPDLTDHNRFITESFLNPIDDSAETFTITDEEGWMPADNVIINPTNG